MYVNKRSNGRGEVGYYRLRSKDKEGQRQTLAEFGRQKPLFREPDLRLGFCEDQLKTVADGSVDLLVDDPPYGTTLAEWDEEPNWSELAEQYHRILADDGQVVVFGKQPSLMPVFNEFTDSGFDFRFELIWKKQNNPWVSDQQPIPIHENIFVFKKSATKVGALTFNTEDIKRDGVFVCPRCEDEDHLGSYSVTRTNDGKSQTQGGWQEVYESSGGEQRHPISFLDRDVLEFTSVTGSSDEYTGYAGQKPVALLRWLVVAMSQRGDRVLDPHMGSASTPMACIPLCRESIGYEADPRRFKTAEERIEGLLDDLRGLKHADVQPAEQRATEAVTGGDD
jgi:site-specific DNA-methyltransferase (adenine-specific)